MNKYSREIKPGVFVDVYDVLRAFEVTDGAIAHALKKLLAPGKRGHKDYLYDLNDVILSINRAIDLHKEWKPEEKVNEAKNDPPSELQRNH